MAEKEMTQVEEVNIEDIMQQIRQQVLKKRAAESSKETVPINIEGKRFSSEFYDHLYQAGLGYDRLELPVLVSKSRIPIVGSIMQWFRTKFHELALYYVNQQAARQINVNTHLLQALNILAEELETELPADLTVSEIDQD